MQQSTKQSTKQSRRSKKIRDAALSRTSSGSSSSPESTASQSELLVDTVVTEVVQVEEQKNDSPKNDSPRSVLTADASDLSTITEEKSPRASDVSPRASLEENTSRVLHPVTPPPAYTDKATVTTVIPLPPQPTMMQKAKNLLATIRTNFSNAATWIKTKAIQAWGHTKAGFNWVGQGLASIVKGIASVIVMAGMMLWNGVKSVGSLLAQGATAIGNGIGSVASKIGSKFTSAVQTVKAKMSKPAAPEAITIDSTIVTTTPVLAVPHENVADEEILMPKQVSAPASPLIMYKNSQQQASAANDAVSEKNSNASPKPSMGL